MDPAGEVSAVGEPGDGREQLVSRAFVTLADTLVDDYDVIDLMDRLVWFSVELLAADAAGIMLGDARRELRAVAASNEAAELMELLQLQNEEGPCLDCFHTGASRSPTSTQQRIGGRHSWLPSRSGVRSGRCMRCRCGCAGRRSGR